MTKKQKKEKRVLPVRSSGEIIQLAERPSKVLYDKVLADEKAERESLNQVESEIVPSTILTESRPHILELPSTKNNVDVLPSNVDVLPSAESNQSGRLDGLPSTVKKSAVHSEKTVPSTNSDRHNKNMARYDNRINPKIKQQIDMFCAEFGFTQREVAEQSAVHFIDMWTAKFSKLVDGKTAQEDRRKMIWKTRTPLINLYLAYNPENKWKFNDDEVAHKYNDFDIRLIELAIIETQFNAGFKKIRSFKYYQEKTEEYLNQEYAETFLIDLLTHYRTRHQTTTGKTINLSFLTE